MKLEELKALCEAATPGPWECSSNPQGSGWGIVGPWFPHEDARAEEKSDANARFIAAAREAMPKLLKLADAVKHDSGYDADGFCDTPDRIKAMRALWEAYADLEAET
jgi:hypothetical protein